MLLLEVAENRDQYAINIISRLVVGTGNDGADKVNAVVNYGLQNWKDAVYHGPMFRVVRLEAENVMTAKSVRDLENLIRSHKGEKGRQYFSFAKTVQGVSQFVTTSREFGGDDYEEHNKNTIAVLCVTQQVGTGLDIKTAFARFKPEGDNSGASTVGEVLGRMEPGLAIKYFHVIGLGRRVNPDEELTDDKLRWNSGEEYWDAMSPEARQKMKDEQRGMHHEKDYYFRPDQFNQMMELLRRQHIQGKNTGVRAKPLHKKSPMKQYKGTAWDEEGDWD